MNNNLSLGLDSFAHNENLNKAFDNDLEKAVPIGTVNKHGKIKTAEGWVYQKKGKGGSPAKTKTAESKEGKKTTGDKIREVVAKEEAKSAKPKISMPKEGASVRINQQGAKLISLSPFEGKDLKVEKIVNTGLISEPQQVKVTDGKGNSIIVSASDLVEGKTEKKKEMSFREVLDDRSEGGGRSIMDSIDEYRGDLSDQPGRKEHMEGLESKVAELEEKTGYKVDISEEREAYKKARSGDDLLAKVKQHQSGTVGKIQSMMAKEKANDLKKGLDDTFNTLIKA